MMKSDAAQTRPTTSASEDPEPRSDGEFQLFEALVRDHSALLNSFITSCVGRTSEAEEIYQETLVTAWRRLRDFDQTRSFGAWLRGIARVHMRAHHRQAAQQPLLTDAMLDGLSARFHTIEQRSGDTLHDKLDCLRACIETLQERDRRAIELRYHEGLRGSPLAAKLETSLENGKKIVQRARARLLACLQSKLRWEAV